MAFSPSTLCAMGGNLWRGLWVLGTELVWVFGKDVPLGRQVRVLRGRRKVLLAQLAARNAAAPGAAISDPTQDELALLEQDLAVAEAERNAAHAAHLAPLRRRFPGAFA